MTAATESVLTHDERFALGIDSRLEAVSMVPGRTAFATIDLDEIGLTPSDVLFDR